MQTVDECDFTKTNRLGKELGLTHSAADASGAQNKCFYVTIAINK